MSHDDTTPISNPRGSKTLDERLEQMDEKLDGIMNQLNEGGKSIAVISLRVRALEYVLYGLCAIGLVILLTSVVSSVLRDAHSAESTHVGP